MSGQLDPKSISVDEAGALAREAFVFGLPLVYIAVQADTATNVARPEGARAPLNQFAHFRQLPDASDQVVVGLNVDTLYSLAVLDLSDGPLVLSVPEMGDRYWLMQMIDAWNNVPHVPGTRTVGGKGGDFAIVGPGWTRSLPAGAEDLRMPTNLALIGGRIALSGPAESVSRQTALTKAKRGGYAGYRRGRSSARRRTPTGRRPGHRARTAVRPPAWPRVRRARSPAAAGADHGAPHPPCVTPQVNIVPRRGEPGPRSCSSVTWSCSSAMSAMMPFPRPNSQRPDGRHGQSSLHSRNGYSASARPE